MKILSKKKCEEILKRITANEIIQVEYGLHDMEAETKPITDAAWVKQYQLRKNKAAIDNYIENSNKSASKGFRNPTIMELYLYAPNADLLPERMVNYELSWLQTFMNHT